jgi:hypothetical protein
MQSYPFVAFTGPAIAKFLAVILCGGFLINDAVRYWLFNKIESRRGPWD